MNLCRGTTHSWKSRATIGPRISRSRTLIPSDYAAVVIPGGRAPEYIRNNPDFIRIVRHFFKEEKPVAHLCHASIALAKAGVLKGRRIAAYPELQSDVEAAGAEFVNSEAVVDGVMVSARAYPDHPAWMREFMKILREKAPVKAGAAAPAMA